MKSKQQREILPSWMILPVEFFKLYFRRIDRVFFVLFLYLISNRKGLVSLLGQVCVHI